jgi:ubiquinone/menaquinone biosynthesis C-methylase UbiE
MVTCSALSKHLLDLDCKVIAVDVSSEFLKIISKRFVNYKNQVETKMVNGSDLKEMADNSFSLVAVY